MSSEMPPLDRSRVHILCKMAERIQV